MAKIQISIAESAFQELEELQNWYSQQGATDIGVRLATEIFLRISTLEANPDIGRIPNDSAHCSQLKKLGDK